MNEQEAVVIGASGLIGSQLIDLLLADDHFRTVRILVRKKLDLDHPKLQQQVTDFTNEIDYTSNLGKGDSIFCCIGTTQKNVKGDKAAYEKIDHDIPVNAARIGSENGFKQFLIVSSVGAKPAARNFYLQLKGKTERDIRQYPFQCISIFRPAMLLGKRMEKRRGEKILQSMMQALSFLLVGGLSKYHPVSGRDVAAAMIAQCKQSKNGVHILEYKQIKELTR